MPAVPHKEWPLADESKVWRWNASAQNAILDAGGWDLYRQAHAWYDEGKSEGKDGYKLPHHLFDGDGGLVTVWRGVVSAMAALLGARGGVDLPDADREDVWQHLAAHYREFDKEPPELSSMSASEFREFHAAQQVAEEVIAFALGERQPIVCADNPRPDWPTTWLDAFKVGRIWYAETESWFEVTRDMLEDIAASVRDSSQPIPIDGAGISEVHETVWDSAARAAGWVYDAEVVEHPDGVHHLWLRAVLHPQVAGLIDQAMLLYGSVAIYHGDDPESGDRYWRLDSYAITNRPRVHGLTPHRMDRERPEPPQQDSTFAAACSGREGMVRFDEGVSNMEQEPKVQNTCECSARVAELFERIQRLEADLFVAQAERELGTLNDERKATLTRLVATDRKAAEDYVAALKAAQPPAGRKVEKAEPERVEKPKDVDAIFAEKAAELKDPVAALKAAFAETGVTMRDVLMG